MMKAEELTEACLKLNKIAIDGDKWLADNVKDVDGEVVRKRLRRSARSLKKYSEAASQKIGVAVFGPSQAGKSTLISSLIKGSSGFPMVDFEGTCLDFLFQINPEGGNETTGLVTRFSVEPPPKSPDPKLPVCLKFFNEMDVVKILANTFFAEAEGGQPIDQKFLTDSLDSLSKKPQKSNNLTIDDLEDLAEYVKAISDKFISGHLLETIFWPRAVTLALKLGIEDRAFLFSFLWGNLKPFTEVYKRLYLALEKLGFCEVAYCSLEALYDEENKRSKSVLHVDRLLGLLDETEETIDVIGQTGRKLALTRPLLSALIAEMHVRIEENPGSYMDNADILDFPGYRAREKLKDIAAEIGSAEVLKKCFLRGKVAYLFERYCVRKEITCMLLCVAESVQNNPDLPIVIANWVFDTHGRTPQERTGKPVCLFFVLTKFDNHLQEGAGSTDPKTRWELRYNASLLQFFGLYHWPREWSMSEGQVVPFKNMFWLLNLSYADGFLKIEKQGEGERTVRKAKGILPEKVPLFSELKRGFLEAQGTQSHFANPDASWNKVLDAEDGGVGYIVSFLTPILETDLKTQQLTALAYNEANTIEQSLKPYYHGGAKEQEKKIKEEFFDKLFKLFSNMALKKQKFGRFLKSMTLPEDELHLLFSTVDPNEHLEAPPQEQEQEIDFMSLFDDDNQDDSVAKATQPTTAVHDLAFRFRLRLEQAWLSRLDELSSDDQSLKFYEIDRRSFQNLVQELSQGARRLGVLTKIESSLRQATSYGNVNPERLLWKQARLASTYLAEFVNFLGLSPSRLASNQRKVTIKNRQTVVFEPSLLDGAFPTLPEIQPVYDIPYFRDWMASFHNLMMNNVDFAEKSYDIEQNNRLGIILDQNNQTRAG
ncbi:MAG: putative virulence factor, partial [Deltaproteobacteria bacterium]|nr:putative virulence factor [Deltaproteobacteria bacterium]